jgi:hypothetical protein
LSRIPTTVLIGTTQQNQSFYVMTDAERDEAMAVQEARPSPAITRPSGDPDARRRPDPLPGQAAGWSGRQASAASRLRHLWRAALPLRGFPKGYGDWGRGGKGCDDPEAAQEAWDDYCKAMDELEIRTSRQHANAVRMAVVQEDASTLARAYLVREGLSFLAHWWRIR